jgi:hypothetical protein
MNRRLPVAGPDRPAVVFGVYLARAEVDHGFDGEREVFFHFWPAAPFYRNWEPAGLRACSYRCHAPPIRAPRHNRISFRYAPVSRKRYRQRGCSRLLFQFPCTMILLLHEQAATHLQQPHQEQKCKRDRHAIRSRSHRYLLKQYHPLSTVLLGKPCTTTSFTDAHMVNG